VQQALFDVGVVCTQGRQEFITDAIAEVCLLEVGAVLDKGKSFVPDVVK
jgi:hypothetical protein